MGGIPIDETSSITSKGQVTIPLVLGKRLKLKSGDQVSFRLEKTQIKVSPVKNPLIDIFGSVEPLKKRLSFKKMRDIALEEKINAIR